jgi:hypothetical protein
MTAPPKPAATAMLVGVLQKPIDGLPSSPPSQNLKFEREDWSLFRTVEGLQQRAGRKPRGMTRVGRTLPWNIANAATAARGCADDVPHMRQ